MGHVTTADQDTRVSRYINERTAPVVLFSRPGCGPCIATRRALDQRGLRFDTIDTSQDECAASYLRALGFTESPVVMVHDGKTWTGFRPDLIEAIEVGHRDTHQTYEHGQFITWCTCGQGFTGDDPDAADAAAMDHTNPEEA